MSPLEAFLRKHKALTKFKRNIKRCDSHIKYTFDQLSRVKDISDAIDKAFTWGDTPEGYEFWTDLYEEAGGIDCVGDYL